MTSSLPPTAHTTAQILLTGEGLRDEERHQNFSNTLNRLLELGTPAGNQ